DWSVTGVQTCALPIFMSKAAKDIFLSAVEIADPRERALHLDQACGGDANLRKRVEALLRAQADPDSFLDHPAVAGQEAISADGQIGRASGRGRGGRAE